MQRSRTRRDTGDSPRWTVGDVIDFEHLVASGEVLIASNEVPLSPADVAGGDRPAVFRRWLDAARSRTRSMLPGTVYTRARRWLRASALVAGVVMGAGLAGALLAGHPSEPVNALLFLGATVGLQVALLIALTCGWMLRARMRTGVLADAGLFVMGALGRIASRLDGERRSDIATRWAAVDLRSARLAPLVGTDLLVATQLFAVAFNVGLLAAMLLVYLPFTELRFGWQSTYSFTAAGVEWVVASVAAPWSWLRIVPVPSTADIMATRYTRGQSAASLPAAAAIAWWPFLIAAIVCYGLVLRVLIGLAAAASLRRRLATPPLASPAAAALWRRLTGPLIASDGPTTGLPEPQASERPRAAGAATVLIVDDETAADTESVRSAVARALGAAIERVVVANLDDDRLEPSLRDTLAEPADRGIAIAVSARRDPIVAVAAFLRSVVAASRHGADVTLVLVGDGVNDERITIWKRFAAIHRLPVGVERGA